MRRLVLVRHGESRWNADGRVQGQACEGLSSLGHAQARVTAAALAAAFPEATLVASDLQRARETVSPLEAELRRTATADPALRERSFGAWEGRLREDIEVEDAVRWRRWRAGEDLVPELGGESAADLADRAVPALLRLLSVTPPGGVTVVVTHGGTIHHGVHRLLGLPPRTLGGVDNTAVVELVAARRSPTPRDLAGSDDDVGPVTLERWNEVGHLPVELRTSWHPAAAADTRAGGERR